MVSALLSWLGANAGGLGIFGAAIAFVWSVVRFMLVRQRDYEAREFKTYHQLIKELVSPNSETKAMWIDRQAAIIFELRRFERYYELTVRMLLGLKQLWFSHPRLIEEIDLTLAHIRKRKPNLS
jgi:hypothetical protein